MKKNPLRVVKPDEEGIDLRDYLYRRIIAVNLLRFKRTPTALLVFEIGISVQSCLKLFEELLLQLGIQIGVFHLVTELS